MEREGERIFFPVSNKTSTQIHDNTNYKMYMMMTWEKVNLSF